MSFGGRAVFSKRSPQLCQWCIDLSDALELPPRHRKPAYHQHCEAKLRVPRPCDCPTCWPDVTQINSVKEALDVLKLDVPKK